MERFVGLRKMTRNVTMDRSIFQVTQKRSLGSKGTAVKAGHPARNTCEKYASTVKAHKNKNSSVEKLYVYFKIHIIFTRIILCKC